MNIVCRNRKERFPFAHPLKDEFRKRKIPLWCLRNYTGVSEPKLSRYLNDIDNMPLDLQIKLYDFVKILDGDFDFGKMKQTMDQENGDIETDATLGEVNKNSKGSCPNGSNENIE